MITAREVFPMRRECPFNPPAAAGELGKDGPQRVRIWDGITPQ